jgi:hypothetical protein
MSSLIRLLYDVKIKEKDIIIVDYSLLDDWKKK